MKRVQVLENQIGLVFKRKKFQKVLQEGIYWFIQGEQVFVFNRDEVYNPPLLEDTLHLKPEVASELHLIEVGDNQIALQFENKRFSKVLLKGEYGVWKGIKEQTFVKVDTSKIEITEDIERQLLDTALLPWIRRYTLESYERGLLLIDGKFEKELESGTYYWWKNATKIDVAKLDIRQQQLEVSGQEILTKDKANVRISFFAHYQVVDLKKALFENKEFEKQLYVMLQISLREYIGEMTLDELVAKKERVSDYILQDVAKEGLTLGVELKTCGIRDIILPGEIKTIMNKVLIAEKTAQANMITQRQETASTRSLLNTAKLMEENQMLWKLKEMEYVEKIAEKINTISVSGNGQILDQLKQIFMKN